MKNNLDRKADINDTKNIFSILAFSTAILSIFIFGFVLLISKEVLVIQNPEATTYLLSLLGTLSIFGGLAFNIISFLSKEKSNYIKTSGLVINLSFVVSIIILLFFN